MSGHTPGPWEVVRRSRKVGGLFDVRSASGAFVANGVARGGSEADGDGNARLIATAPELLDLLEKHLAWFDGSYTPADEDAFIAATRAAIAKARGAQ